MVGVVGPSVGVVGDVVGEVVGDVVVVTVGTGAGARATCKVIVAPWSMEPAAGLIEITVPAAVDVVVTKSVFTFNPRAFSRDLASS